MNYLQPHGECISIFDLCQAYQQLEADYNRDGWAQTPMTGRLRPTAG